MESFDGVTILASNLRRNMDAAFTRRLPFLLDFPVPDVEMRRRLWEQALPNERYRAEDLDLTEFVERFTLSGGTLKGRTAG